MHIAVDLDDVVLDFCGGLVSSVNMEFGTSFTPEDIDQWDLKPILGPTLGRGPMTWLRDREWIWATFPAVPGAMGGLEQLRDRGHYLELLTSKPKWAEHNVWKWLGKWRPPFQRVTIVGPEDVKRDLSEATILIDDKPKNLIGFETGILFDRPHNRTADEVGIVRATSWAQVVALVEMVGR